MPSCPGSTFHKRLLLRQPFLLHVWSGFVDAEQVLTGPCVTFVDDRFDYGEKRFITLGLLAGRVVIIAHAARGDDITRIISMRKANRREQKSIKSDLARVDRTSAARQVFLHESNGSMAPCQAATHYSS